MKLTETRQVGAVTFTRSVECGDTVNPFTREALLEWLHGDWQLPRQSEEAKDA